MNKSMKSEVDQLDAIRREPTVEPLPSSLVTEAGILLDIEGNNAQDLKLAKDGHVWHLH
jgi:hypothetical protein